MMQVDELWTALECFNMNQDLGRRIVRGRKNDALAMLKDLAQTACPLALLPPSCTLRPFACALRSSSFM